MSKDREKRDDDDEDEYKDERSERRRRRDDDDEDDYEDERSERRRRRRDDDDIDDFRYSDLPWYRKSSSVSLLTLFGLCCGPAILAVCIIVLTGDVYYDKRDRSGNLKKWGAGNKVAAIIILVLQVIFTILYAAGTVARQGGLAK
jgi:hypothetical protein